MVDQHNGGMDLSIRGPLVGDNHRCDIQFYVAIDGLCAWHSNHNADAPWMQRVASTNSYSRETALQAMRLAGLLAVTFNALGTELNLPFGGYGVLGVCNDSAALIDFALRGETNMYPLISTGRFLSHTARRLTDLQQALKLKLTPSSVLERTLVDIHSLIDSVCHLDSDIHNSPGTMRGATTRYLANYPTSYFQLTEKSKEIMISGSKLVDQMLTNSLPIVKG